MSDPIGASPYLWAAQPSVINVTGGGGGSALVQWGPHFGGPTGDVNNIGINTTMPALAATYPLGVGIRAGLPGSAPIQVGSLAINYNTLGIGIHQAASVLGAPFFQTISTVAQTANSTTITITKPTGTVDGELLVAGIGSATVSAAESLTAPSGWTLILQTNNVNALGSNLLTYYKFASSEGADYTWTGGISAAHIGWIMRISGIDPTTPINVSVQATGSATDPVAPTMTTTVVNCLKIACCAQQNALAASYTPPASYLERSDLTGSNLTVVQITGESATRVQAATGASGAVTMDSTQLVASQYCAQHIAIAPGTLVLT